MKIILAALIVLLPLAASAADKPIGKPVEKPIGWVKPSPTPKPNCDNLETYLNTPSCARGRRE